MGTPKNALYESRQVMIRTVVDSPPGNPRPTPRTGGQAGRPRATRGKGAPEGGGGAGMWGEGRFGAGLGVRQGRPPGQGPGGGMGGANHSPFETIAYLPGTVTAPSRGGPALTFLLLWISPDPSPKPRQARPPPGRGRPPPLAEPAGPARARARGGSRKKHWMPKTEKLLAYVC